MGQACDEMNKMLAIIIIIIKIMSGKDISKKLQKNLWTVPIHNTTNSKNLK